jgi:hypothetical protein
MKFRRISHCVVGVAGLVLCLTVTAIASAQSSLSESWQTGYGGRDANGPHVIGYWKFEPDAVTRDSSSNGHTLTLAGAQAVEQGKFGGALESFPGWPVEDKRHAAYVASQPALSPRGAFTAEMWIKPKPELTANLQPVLLDKKYAGHTDYQLRLSSADRSGARTLQVHLGFGDASETFSSEPFVLDADNWQHIAFTYDGAGEVRFFRNGAPVGIVTRPGRGPVAPGRHPLSIGDRVGSYYAGFPGYIDEVRLCHGALEFRPVSVEFRSERTTWLRMEPAPDVRVVVRNLTKSEVQSLKLRVALAGIGETMDFDVPPLASGATWEAPYSFDTSLRPDTYRLRAELELPGAMPYASVEHAEFVLAPRPLAKMPVMMWGIGSAAGVQREIARLKDLGFTHCLGGRADYGSIWEAKKPVPPAGESQLAETKQMLDFALSKDFGVALALSPGHWLKQRNDMQRVDRDGQPYSSRPDVNAALPGLPEFCYNVGASVAQAYEAFPAWQAVLVNTETRDSSQVSFSKFDRDAYREAAGVDIPDEVMIKNGVEWGKLKNFPSDRIVPDDHPLLAFYRWFWSKGDGWNELHSAVHRGVKSTGRDDVWTWFDPAIRAPSLPGSGGSVDVLGQWTYTNPDPLRIGYYTDELFAMAAHAPQPQRVMKMTQLFWYRSATAPKNARTEHIYSPFDDHDPDAAYITISPMHLRESFWTKIARPVSGLMYHGWQALVPTDGTSGYRYTHPDTQHEFRRLHRDVLEPLGPMLLQVADRPSDVAYLNSFTAQMFARRGSYGYSEDEAYLTLLYAQLQPQVIFEDTLLTRGLDSYKVLVLADCDVLTESVAERIRDFQKRGGLVIGDDNLAPGIQPDLRLPKVRRTKKADADKATLIANAAKLRSALDAHYSRHTDCTNPEIVTRCRQAGESDYVFVVNDRREFGDYVGRHELVMDNGLPSGGEIILNRPEGHIYDLVSGREVPQALVTSRDGQLRWPVDLGPCEGRIFLVSPQPITAVDIAAADSIEGGSRLHVEIAIADNSGQAVQAVVPVHVEISDPAGRSAEFSGYHAARNGRLDLRLDMARNDEPGVWQIRVRELASGLEGTRHVRLMERIPAPASD